MFSGGVHYMCCTLWRGRIVCGEFVSRRSIVHTLVGFMRRDFFHRIASSLQWYCMLIWDVTLVHTLSFEWMVVGNMQDFAKIALQAVCSTLGKTRCAAIVAPPTHTFSFHGLTVCVCTCQLVRLCFRRTLIDVVMYFEVQRSW